MNEILIATDGSTGATVAVQEGVRIAQQAGAGVVFVAVAREPLLLLGEPYYQRALTNELRRARAAVDAAIPFAVERRVGYDTEIVEGDPAGALLDVARSRGSDLIVVGSRGRRAVTASALGSVSTELVHHADRPVLVARA